MVVKTPFRYHRDELRSSRFAADTSLRVGDWAFQHPRQSDVLFQLETIHLVRGGRLLEETMAAYPRRL